jgi:CTP:molybdopterin cytidylyltransferase MocA
VSIAAVVVAAGASTRLGEAKQLIRFGSENLLERAVRLAGDAGCSPVVVVLGASAGMIQAGSKLGSAIVVVNEDWAEGMGSSVRAGVGALHGVDGCVVMTCDMPAVTAIHLGALMGSGDVVGSCYAGKRGVPAYFPVPIFPSLLQLRGDAGAKDLLVSARCVELPGGELDVDTPEDLVRARKLFGQH